MGMAVDGRIVELAVALLLGSGASWLFVRRSLSRRFDLKLRRIVDMHRKQHEAVVDKLNASHALARKELEHQRKSVPRQISVASADQRSAVARLEEQLKLAYSELDRLRLEVKGPAPVGRPKVSNGFADTQPFEPRQKALQR
jgi:multidrug resistance efflux pump